MKIQKSVVFEEEDASTLAKMAEQCSEAREFFDEDGVHAVNAVAASCLPVSEEQLCKAKDAVSKALGEVEKGNPHLAAVDMKSLHRRNLLSCYWKLEGWWHEVRR